MKEAKYARVMHHIGGLSGANDNSSMIRGGEDTLTLIQEGDLPEGLDVKRLVSLGAIRPATEAEVAQWEGRPEQASHFATVTSGLEALHPELGKAGGATGQQGTEGTGEVEDAGTANANSLDAQFNGMGKGELSEFTVPELKNFAKDAGIEGFNEMKKEELLDALLASGKK